MDLPLGEPVSIESLSDSEKWALDRVPRGAVDRDGRWVIRVCRPVSEVAAVVAWGQRLEPLLKQIAPFTRVAQRMVVLDRVPVGFEEVAWQARYEGVGVWTANGNGVSELVAAEPVRPRRYPPARWHVNEYAYRSWLTAQLALASSNRGCHD